MKCFGHHYFIMKIFKASLTEQSEAQAFLTMQLINKIGVFSDSQRGDFS